MRESGEIAFRVQRAPRPTNRPSVSRCDEMLAVFHGELKEEIGSVFSVHIEQCRYRARVAGYDVETLLGLVFGRRTLKQMQSFRDVSVVTEKCRGVQQRISNPDPARVKAALNCGLEICGAGDCLSEASGRRGPINPFFGLQIKMSQEE